MGRWIFWGVFISGLLLTYGLRESLSAEQLQNTLAQWGWWAPLIFFIAYAVLSTFGFPGALLTLTGGFLFGLWWGTLLNLSAATLGATWAFLLARLLGREWVASRDSKLFQKILKGVEREGWRFVMLVRLIPLFPFNLTNYAFGLTPLSLGQYVWATAVFMIPGCFAYTYLGTLGQSALTDSHSTFVSRLLLGFGLIVLLLMLPTLLKRWRRLDEL